MAELIRSLGLSARSSWSPSLEPEIYCPASPLSEFDCSSSAVRRRAASAIAQNLQPPAPPGPPVVVASGVATVKRAPDQAFVTFITESRAARPAEAQKLNAQAMAQVQEAVKRAGIPADAVRTLSFNLREDVDWVNGKRTSRGYVVSNAIEVRVDKLDDVGRLLDAAVTAGATNVSDIRFELKDRSGAEREAVRLAVADARARADAAAEGAGTKVVKCRAHRGNVRSQYAAPDADDAHGRGTDGCRARDAGGRWRD